VDDVGVRHRRGIYTPGNDVSSTDEKVCAAKKTFRTQVDTGDRAQVGGEIQILKYADNAAIADRNCVIANQILSQQYRISLVFISSLLVTAHLQPVLGIKTTGTCMIHLCRYHMISIPRIRRAAIGQERTFG
jgi:hypothetical protein